jgi:mono/diheme cytochrome c family protein
MKSGRMALAMAGAAFVGLAPASVVAQKFDLGQREYNSSCAVCHGLSGNGDGPYKGMIADNQGGSDITTLAKRNGGVFPFQRVVETIDGRVAVKVHGPRDMPIWGTDYLARVQLDYRDSPYDPEAYVRMRILALAEYVNRLQVK